MAPIQSKVDGSSSSQNGGFSWFESAPEDIDRVLTGIGEAQRRADGFNAGTATLLEQLTEVLRGGAIASSSTAGKEHGDTEGFLDQFEPVRDWGADAAIESSRRGDEIADHHSGENTRDRNSDRYSSKKREGPEI